MPWHAPYDMILADPPYGDTSLAWDRRVGLGRAGARRLKPTGSLWVFGSLRSFMATADHFANAGLRIAQEVIWEKQNGTGFHNDRFKRVHELAVQFVNGNRLARHLQRRPDHARRNGPHGAAQAATSPIPARSTPAVH